MRRPRQNDALIFHDLCHARAAFAAAADAGHELHLLTPPGGARYAGASFYRHVLDLAAAEHGDVGYRATLDCGADGALALVALGEGWRSLVLGGNRKTRAEIQEVGERYGAVVLGRAPKAWDLARAADPENFCRNLFAGTQQR